PPGGDPGPSSSRLKRAGILWTGARVGGRVRPKGGQPTMSRKVIEVSDTAGAGAPIAPKHAARERGGAAPAGGGRGRGGGWGGEGGGGGGGGEGARVPPAEEVAAEGRLPAPRRPAPRREARVSGARRGTSGARASPPPSGGSSRQPVPCRPR